MIYENLKDGTKARFGAKAAGAGLMIGGAAKALTAITGYSLISQALIMDIDNTSGADFLCTVFGS